MRPPRALRVTNRGRDDLDALAPRSSAAWPHVKRALLQLTRDRALPGPEDIMVKMPHQILGGVVPEAGLVITYVPGIDEVSIVALIERLPVVTT